ncbi:MAG TPA: hypothetical protein P5280_03795 [Cyclobacteriaceae bacterium]|nr:hypothetical protein [Cyclobacteriaceae bacterium]
MKRTTSILLLAAILVHLIGFYVYFMVRLGQIRSEMRENIALLSPDEMQVFELTPDEYNSARENDHEVKINGRMYDHATPRVENGMVILYAKHDQAEDNLLALLEEVVSTATSDTQKVPTELTIFFDLDFIIQCTVPVNYTLAPKERSWLPIKKILSEKISVESPPPQA